MQQVISARVASCAADDLLNRRPGAGPVLALFERVPKTGSTSVENLLDACSSQPSPAAAGACTRSAVSYVFHGHSVCFDTDAGRRRCTLGGVHPPAMCRALKALIARGESGALMLHQPFFQFSKASGCAWPRPPVRLLATLRKPASRAASSYNYYLEQCICQRKPSSWCRVPTAGGVNYTRADLCAQGGLGGKARYSFNEAVALAYAASGTAPSPAPPRSGEPGAAADHPSSSQGEAASTEVAHQVRGSEGPLRAFG